MELTTGQVVWIAFATGSESHGGPYASVSRGVVIDGEHRVVKRDNGYVGICRRDSVEQCYATSAEAWAANIDMLERHIEAVRSKIAECRAVVAEVAA